MEPLCILRCDRRQRQFLVYFALSLDCNVSILDSLFFTSFAYFAFANDYQKQTFALQLDAHVEDRIRQRIGIQDAVTRWNRPRTQLEWIYNFSADTLDYEFILRVIHIDYGGLRSTFSVSNGRLRIRQNDQLLRLRPGVLDVVIDTAIESALKIFTQYLHFLTCSNAPHRSPTLRRSDKRCQNGCCT